MNQIETLHEECDMKDIFRAATLPSLCFTDTCVRVEDTKMEELSDLGSSVSLAERAVLVGTVMANERKL